MKLNEYLWQLRRKIKQQKEAKFHTTTADQSTYEKINTDFWNTSWQQTGIAQKHCNFENLDWKQQYNKSDVVFSYIDRKEFGHDSFHFTFVINGERWEFDTNEMPSDVHYKISQIVQRKDAFDILYHFFIDNALLPYPVDEIHFGL